MPSSYKTPYLKLNRWVGSDKPKRDDWNTDNERIDTGVQTVSQELEKHLVDEVSHITKKERVRWNQGHAHYTYLYTGDGTAARNIDLGENISFGLIFPIGKPLVNATPEVNCYSAILSSTGCSQGASLRERGFTVHQQQRPDPSNFSVKLNEKGVPYLCVYWI